MVVFFVQLHFTTRVRYGFLSVQLNYTIRRRHILHAYIEDMDIEPLIDHLAPDVVWLGAGREMNAVGRDTVARIFRQGKDQLIPCHMSEERELIYPLDEKLWLV